MKPRFVKLSWVPMPKRFSGMAITIAPFIFYNGVMSEELKRHELVHIEQVKRLGWIRFYLTYLWYMARYGYKNNPFEVEARNS